MLAQISPWYAHAAQRTAAAPAHALTAPARMEWSTHAGIGPGAEILGRDLCGKRILELGCGPGHNVAHLARHHQARVTGVDLIGLQVRRARSHYGHIDGATFAAGHALHHLQATGQTFDAIYSVFGAVGLVAPSSSSPPSHDAWNRAVCWPSPSLTRHGPEDIHPRTTVRARTTSPCPTAPDCPSPDGSSTPTAGEPTSPGPVCSSPRRWSCGTRAATRGPPPS